MEGDLGHDGLVQRKIKNRSARQDNLARFQFVRGHPFAVHPRAIAGVQIDQQVLAPFPCNHEVTPRKQIVIYKRIHTFTASHDHRLIVDDPCLAVEWIGRDLMKEPFIACRSHGLLTHTDAFQVGKVTDARAERGVWAVNALWGGSGEPTGTMLGIRGRRTSALRKPDENRAGRAPKPSESKGLTALY